jgi:hypothetical protein
MPTLSRSVALCLLTLTCTTAGAQQPLHQRVDALIAAGTPNFDKLAAPLAADEEFLRRVHLDLTGCIPSAEQVRVFLADRSPDKRQKLIDALLASPEFARHFAAVFDLMLMERRPPKSNLAGPWREYLRESLAANKPCDMLVREILSSDGSDP